MNIPRFIILSAPALRLSACLAFTLIATVATSPVGYAQATQSGVVRGRVFNGATGENLANAVVSVAGSGVSALTERDGTFTLAQVPVGAATLKVTYPGLDDATATVAVPANGEATQDFKLTSSIYTLESVSVTAVREGNAAAIARQEAALTVGNSVSSDAYGNIAKGDMGSFLQRMPGVVGEYGGSAVDAISVRGLSPEFTSVTMDGSRYASANPDSRSQLVSGIATGAIESIEVIKTPTADMDAESLGGVVNMRSRSGFDRSSRTIVLNASASYNETMGEHLDISGSGRKYFPNYSVDYSDVFMVFGRKLGVSFTGGYQEVGDGLQTIRAAFAGNWNYSSPTVGRQVLYADQEYHLNKRVNFQAKFDYKLSRESSVSFTAGWTRFVNVMDQNRPQYTDNLTFDAVNSTSDLWLFTRSSYRTQRDFRYTPSETWNFNLNGKTAVGAIKLAWAATYSDSFRPLDRMSATARSNNLYSFTYDRRASKEFPTLTFAGAVTPPNDPFTNMLSIALTGTHEDASDKVASVKLDASRDFLQWRFPVKLKTGFRVRQQDRDRDADSITGTLAAGDYSRYRVAVQHGWLAGRYPATPIIDTKAIFRDVGISYLPSGLPTRPTVQFTYNAAALPLTAANLDTSVTNSLQNDYQTRETIPAGYVQSEVKLASKLQMTAGLRFEQTRASITSRFENTRATTPEARFGSFRTVESDYVDWFPNLQFRYEPIKRFTVRANYSTTIGRPRISDLVGRFAINDLGQTVSFSNPSLKPQISSNYDVSLEYYFKPVGVVSIGAFRKDIKNYVTATSFRITGNEFGLDLSDYVGWQGNSRINSGNAKVQGMEFNYSQQLSFLPGLARGFGVMANWTVLNSAGDYNGVVTTPLPFANSLTGMRPRSGNAGITYNYSRWDLRVMWNYSDTYLSSLNTGDPSSSEFIGRRGQYDFFARYKVTKTINVFLDVINLGEENRGRYNGLYRPDRRAQTNLFPRSISAGIQARF